VTHALPFTQATAERAMKAALKLGLRVTGMTVKPDGAIMIHTVEEQDGAGSLTLTSAPKLRDAREKFRAG
jgi:hypothetical protein